MIKEFAKDVLSYLPSKAVPGIFGILIIPVITRLLNSSEYGEYFLVVSTISLISIFAADWITPSVVRFYAEYDRTSRVDLFNGTIFRITGYSALTIAIVIFISMNVFESYHLGPIYHYLNVTILIFIFSVFFSVMMEMLVAKRKPNLYSFFHIWRQCVCLLIGLAFASLWQRSVNGLLWGMLVGIIIMTPLLFTVTIGKVTLNHYSRLLRSDILRYGFPLVFTNVGAWVMALSDRYVIQYFQGSHEVGLYSISHHLADRSISLIVSLIVLASAPIVVQIWEKNGAAQTKIFIAGITRVYLIITIPAVVALSLLSKPIIQLLTTKDFFNGYKIMPMVAAGIFIFGLQRNYQLGLLLHKKTKIIMYSVFFSAALNFILNIILIPKYGFIAAGYSNLLAYACFAVINIIYSRRYLTWSFPFLTFFKVLVSVIFMGLVIFIIMMRVESNLWVIISSVASGIITYFGILFLLKEFRTRSITEVLKMF